MQYIQNSSNYPLVFLMISSVDHISPATGLTPTVTISKNGGAFASPIGAISEVGNGWYKVAGNINDTDTLGPLIIHATSVGADPTDMNEVIVGSGLVDLGPIQYTSIVGNIQGAVGSVTNPVTCIGEASTPCTCKCCRVKC